jgi:soluble lytic murein transglycosylase-like protein
MTGTQKALVPGILAGILLLIGLSRLAAPVPLVVAAAEDPNSPQKIEALQTNSSSTCAFFERYPEKIRPWCGIIESTSGKYNIDPLLIAAVMLQESGGQPEVISHSGAVGLMQVMPRDGLAANFQCINGPCFASRPSIQELLDPTFNVNYGVRMLAGLINRSGEIREALKSYGPYDVGYIYADKVLTIHQGL